MEKNNFWNDAARYGAVIGCILALSGVLESMMLLSGSVKLYVLLIFEFLAVVALHYYLLHRFTRRRSMLYTVDEGFTFGQGYGFLLAMSGFSGIIVGGVQAIYLHLIVGYSNYVDRYLASLTDLMAQTGGVNASMEGVFSQLVDQMRTAPVPSVLSTVWGGIWSNLLFGAVFGLIIAGVLARASRPFDAQNE